MTSKLTLRQEAFAQAYINGMSQSDAYRASFDCPNSSDKTIWEKASRLFADDKVKARINELRAQNAEKQLWTREMSIRALISVFNEGKPNEQVSAIKELNAMHGFNEPSKLEISTKQITIDDFISKE